MDKWYIQSLMGLVIGLFVTTGVYFVENRPTKKSPIPYFSVANHNAELNLRAANYRDEPRKAGKPNETIVRLVQ